MPRRGGPGAGELERAAARRRAAERRLADLEAGEADRLRFGAEHAWRAERVTAIDAELARHWGAATLAAVRQDDPLAFGIDRLRAARAAYADDLAATRASLPPDRSARRHPSRGGRDRRRTGPAPRPFRRRPATPAELDVASQRHWGRRDKQAVAPMPAGGRTEPTAP